MSVNVAIPEIESQRDDPLLYESLSKLRAAIQTNANRLIAGRAVLVAGVVTISCSSVGPTSRITCTSSRDAGTPGRLSWGGLRTGMSFVISSDSATDTSTIDWHLVNE